MIVPGTLYRITRVRPFIFPGNDVEFIDAGETVTYLSHHLFNEHHVVTYFLYKGQIVKEGATIRHHGNDLLLTLMTCLDDMEEIW